MFLEALLTIAKVSPDATLAQRLRQKDVHAFEQRYDRHSRIVHQLLPRIVQPAGTAEEVRALMGSLNWQKKKALILRNLAHYLPYRSAKRVLRRAAASSNRRRSSGVFTISGGTGLGIRVCSSTATNVTYAVVVCLLSPVNAFSE